MMRASGRVHPGTARTPPRLGGMVLLAVLAFALGTAIRFGIGHDRPLWIDETFTGAIAAQPDLAGLLHQVRADVNAPLYYLLLFLWSSAAGVSDAALRLPSAVFGTLACLAAFRGSRGIDRPVALLWGALLGLWIPGLLQGGEARAYALLLFTATAATTGFAGLLAAPTRGRAALWAAWGAAAILTHYFAVFLIAAQALVLVILHGRRSAALWPAAVPFLPALAWMLFHAPRVAAFAQPDIVWYERLGVADLPAIWGYVLNGPSAIVPLAVCAIVAWRERDPDLSRPAASPAQPSHRIVTAVAAASLVAAAAVVVLGFVRPSFVPRYLVPFVPGLILGVAGMAVAAGRRRAYVPTLAVALFALPLIRLMEPRGPTYAFAAASQAVADAGARKLVFLWDHPAAPVQDPAQMRAVGGFFLARAGHPVAVVDVANSWHDDPAPRLLRAAGSDPDTAILWLYDGGLRKTAALAHPPRIDRDPSWSCTDHGAAPFVALVCLRVAASVSPPR